ncbi:MAG TPA: LamG domain-containing protein, partial [Gammaproteobacteria bacterium]|nr:LamG domain-containing protein [Gammaproteobacteria bacterium]
MKRGRLLALLAAGALAPSLALAASWHFDEIQWTAAPGQVIDEAAALNGRAFGGATTFDALPALAGDPGSCRYGTFDGNDDYVEVPDNPALDLASEVTVAAWVRLRSAPPSDLYTIASKDTNYEYHVNTSRQVYWWWNDSLGTTRSLTTVAALGLDAWHHVAITYKSGAQAIYIDGVLAASATYTGALATNDLPFYVGTDWNFIARAFDGDIDEVNVLGTALSQAQLQALAAATHPCPAASVQFTINHDGFGIHCLAETVTVNVIDSTTGTPLLNYNAPVEIDTQTGSGTWSLTTGGGTFSDGAANDGAATYTWPLGQSQAVFALSYPAGPPAVDVHVFQISNPGIRDTNAEGALVFSPNGFTVTAAALSNPPGGVISFAASQVAGTSFALHLAAYGQTPDDPVCGIIEGYTGDKSVKFWTTYANPALGALAVTIDGVAAAAADGAAAPQTVTFANGQAVVAAKYKDVGQIRVSMKDDSLVDATQLPNGIRGATANFVVRPYDFLLTNIANGAGTLANPQANDATGAVFVAAGAPFRATVTARDAEGSVTPSYGREAIPETVRLVPQLHAPTGGAAPPVASSAGFGAFANGTATGSDFTWPEVGIVRLLPHVGDGDYLGAGDAAVATPSERVGRFVPSHFMAALNTPLFATACSAGGFTYAGQPFVFATPPQITVTAAAVGGTTTTNSTGAFFKLATSTLQNRVYTSAGGALDASGL